MHQHSLGPWANDGGVVYSVPLDTVRMIEGADGDEIAHHTGMVALVYGHHVGPERHYTYNDNARLIAAAPDLLAALEDIAKSCGDLSIVPDIDDGERRAWRAVAAKARAAIRKAKGEPA